MFFLNFISDLQGTATCGFSVQSPQLLMIIIFLLLLNQSSQLLHVVFQSKPGEIFVVKLKEKIKEKYWSEKVNGNLVRIFFGRNLVGKGRRKWSNGQIP